ncbi:hypothetical protein GBAR_LOCUS26490 [Geodia barretti]|uniref:Uncharacterized protein n=1 Tax=Geodia barretti TaxID=519541 RepID=A0AA35THQ8_GEOBA|nr:hypothetical protein GBAR_LOCUS26490 [Geodia barretti]
MKSEDVWVVTMRVVVDTVWIGLNTGHVLIFSTITGTSKSAPQQPQLLTHFKLHEGEVRQLLLLHPSYMGPSSIERDGEQLLSSMTGVQTPYDERVYVLSCGEGLVKQLPTLSHTGTIVGEDHHSAAKGPPEPNREDLYAVMLEGMCESRVSDMESKCERPFFCIHATARVFLLHGTCQRVCRCLYESSVPYKYLVGSFRPLSH